MLGTQSRGHAAGDRKSALVRYGLVAIALMNVGFELIKMYFVTSARGVEGRYGRVRAEVASVNHRTSSLERTMPRADALAPEVEETRAETAAATALAPEVEETTTPANVRRRERECGSPAVDGYAHVNLTCLAMSATAREFAHASASGREKLRAHIEEHASYDGVAVRWGIHHTTETAEECGERCKEHVVKPDGIGAEVLPCNVFVWCPKDVGEGGCFEPDAHQHFAGDCWLKFSETPENVEVNQRGANDAPGFVNKDGKTFAERHANAPKLVHWSSGVLLPESMTASSTLGPRATW